MMFVHLRWLHCSIYAKNSLHQPPCSVKIDTSQWKTHIGWSLVLDPAVWVWLDVLCSTSDILKTLSTFYNNKLLTWFLLKNWHCVYVWSVAASYYTTFASVGNRAKCIKCQVSVGPILATPCLSVWLCTQMRLCVFMCLWTLSPLAFMCVRVYEVVGRALLCPDLSLGLTL